MDPTTSTTIDDVIDPEAFYDGLASSYDLMTGFEERFARERALFQRIVTDYHIQTAIDAGSGSGFHALLLAQMGVQVTAVDISARMLERVEEHARALKLSVPTVRSSFQELGRSIREPVDAVFCLGNSLSHLPTDGEIAIALANFTLTLTPGGFLIVQILNYQKILATRERIVGVQQRGDTMFIRFYDFDDPLLRFNILQLHRQGESWRPEMQSTLLRPLLQNDLARQLAAAGFAEVSFYGGMTLEAYHPDRSRDLVVIARKPRQV